MLWYQKKSTRMLTPKAVLRVAELLETPEIAALNRAAGFGDPAAKKAPLGRWQGGREVARAARDEPADAPGPREGRLQGDDQEPRAQGRLQADRRRRSSRSSAGSRSRPTTVTARSVSTTLEAREDASASTACREAEICETIVTQKLRYKDVVGRLPKDIGLTPAIMVALLPSLSDRDLRQLTPTLEELGLLSVPEIRARWEKAIETATDQRALNIAKNVRDAGPQGEARGGGRQRRQEGGRGGDRRGRRARDVPHRQVGLDGGRDREVEGGARARSSPASRSRSCTSRRSTRWARCCKPKAASRAAVQHMLAPIKADGGTIHGAAVHALHRDGVRVPADGEADRDRRRRRGRRGRRAARARVPHARLPRGRDGAARSRGTRARHDGARLRARAARAVQRGHGRPVRRPVPRAARAPRAARGAGRGGVRRRRVSSRR